MEDTLFNTALTNGIQDFKIIEDTIFINTKIKFGINFSNYVFIEKLKYNFEDQTFFKGKKGFLINFGNTFNDENFKSLGNTFVDLYHKNDSVFLLGLSSTDGSVFPNIFEYKLSDNDLKRTGDYSSYSLTGHNFNSEQIPFIKTGDNVELFFGTTSGSNYFINNFVFDDQLEIKELRQYSFTEESSFRNSFKETIAREIDGGIIILTNK